jgi:AcrR family transcriptional regulator
MAPKRTRRTPEEARRVILDAAEAAVAAGGPASLRLTDVAREAGVSHPTVLHHFGSRAGLIIALNRRTLDNLRANLLEVMQGNSGSNDSAVAQTFAAYRAGLAQRMLWLMQQPDIAPPQKLPIFEEMVERFHALRVSLAAPGVRTDPHDSRAIVHLMSLAGFADAVIGARLRNAPDAKEEAAQRQKFESWFAALLDDYIGRKAGR